MENNGTMWEWKLILHHWGLKKFNICFWFTKLGFSYNKYGHNE